MTVRMQRHQIEVARRAREHAERYADLRIGPLARAELARRATEALRAQTPEPGR